MAAYLMVQSTINNEEQYQKYREFSRPPHHEIRREVFY